MAFSDARTNAPEVKVKLHRDQAGPDTSTATAIDAIGEFGGQLRKGQVKGNLEQSLNETGNIIDTLNHADTITEENPDGSVSIDMTRSDPTGTIDTTSAKFQRIAAGLDQGKISQSKGAIEAEVVLRQSIARAPGFATELRKEAANILGFNPSGAVMKDLFLSGPDSTITTQLDKDMNEAKAFVDIGMAATVEDGYRLVVGARAREAQKAETQFMIANGRINAPKIAVRTGQMVQTSMNDGLLQAFAQINTGGGVSDTDTIIAGMRAGALQVISDTHESMRANSDIPYEQSAYDKVVVEANRIRDANIALVEDQDMLKVMTKQKDLIQTLMELEAAEVSPLLVMLAPFGEAAVTAGLELLAMKEGDPKRRDALVKLHPQYAFIAEMDILSEDIGPAIQAIKRGNLAELMGSGGIDQATGEAVAMRLALDATTGIGDPENFSDVVKTLSDINKPNTVMSMAAQTTNSYALADPAARASITRDFSTGQHIVKSNITSKLAGTNWALGWDETNNEFIIQDRQNRAESQFKQFSDSQPFNPSQFSGVTDFLEARQRGIDTRPGVNVNPAGIATEELKSLNKMMLPLLKDPRWASEFGIVDRNGWATDFIADANTGAIEAELNDFSSDTNSTLDFTQQARLRQAISLGNQQEIFKVLEDAGMGTFNEQANVGRPLERGATGDTFVDTENGQILRIGPNGKIESVVAASGRFPSAAELEAAGPEGVEIGAGKAPSSKADITDLISTAANERGIDPDLALAIAMTESSLDPKAKNPNSSATGLFQNTDGNFSDFGDGGDRTDPIVSTNAGLTFLEHVIGKSDGNVEEALRLWHDGQNSTKPLSPEGKKFIEKVKQAVIKLKRDKADT